MNAGEPGIDQHGPDRKLFLPPCCAGSLPFSLPPSPVIWRLEWAEGFVELNRLSPVLEGHTITWGALMYKDALAYAHFSLLQSVQQQERTHGNLSSNPKPPKEFLIYLEDAQVSQLIRFCTVLETCH